MSSAFLDHYVQCLNERRADDLALIVADELTHNGQRMTRQQWWDRPVGQHLTAVPDRHGLSRMRSSPRAGSRCATKTPARPPAVGWARATGARISFREHVFYTITSGRITGIWSVFDSETVHRQLSPEAHGA